MKNILWIALVVILAIMLYQGALIAPSGYSLLKLQCSDAIEGSQILRAWNHASAGDRTLLSIAKSNTRLDFLFIFVYILQLITLSNALMQREKNIRINELLRMNIMLAVIAGLLDLVENIIQLHNFHFPMEQSRYIPTMYPSTVKWILVCWIILVLLISRIKRVLFHRDSSYREL